MKYWGTDTEQWRHAVISYHVRVYLQIETSKSVEITVLFVTPRIDF